MMEETGVGADGAAPTAQAPGGAADGDAKDTLPRSFDEMHLSPEVRQALEGLGWFQPTEVQSAVFQQVMAGKDLQVQSRTGSGKTGAFGIPIAQSLVDTALGEVQALALCPTRELALQVADECGKIGAQRGIKVAPIYGGAPMGKQIDQLKAGAHMVAGTPGRVLDHLRRGTLSLDRLKLLVLDEADEMLSMGFYEEISEILKRCPTDRQTLLFSATIPEEIERISRKYMREPEKIVLSADFIGVHQIQHAYYMVKGMGRPKDLLRVLEVEKPDSAIIFCNTREETSTVAEFLRRNGLDAEAISSDLTQKDRERVMGRMRAGNLHYLVATDIAARGIDISDLTHVINFTFPESAEVYVHRTGRTGRAGKSGIAISLIGPRELGNFYYLKLTYKIKPEERTLPSEEELTSRREGDRIEQLAKDLAGRKPSEEWRSLARRLWAAEGGESLVAALIERHFHAPAATAPVAGPPSTATAPSGPAGTPATITEPSVAAEAIPPSDPERRERRDRDRGARGGRSEGRDGRRGRGERGGRDEKRAGERRERKPRELRAGQAPAPHPDAPVIQTDAGKDFWEAWVDSKGSDASPAAAASPTPEGGAAPTESESPRRERRERAPSSQPPGTTRLYLNLGRRDGLTPEELDQLLAARSVAVRGHELRNSHTYLYVEPEQADAAIAALTGGTHRDREMVCEPSRKAP